mmetsp:Transcript_52613/g.87146  ORF Transcript_52613/g.87146 Transcript_52613/m.87146 type:complete len:231 (-) Transcript_52613:997-1689(-)
MVRRERSYNVVVPQEERTLRHLKMIGANRVRDAHKQRLDHALQLLRAGQLQHLLQLVEEEQLLLARHTRPKLEHSAEHRRRQRRILLNELRHTIRQLRVELRQKRHLVHRDQHVAQKQNVLLFQRQCKAIDDGAQNLEQLGNAIVAHIQVNHRVQNVVHRLANKRAKRHTTTINAMQNHLEIVAFTRVLRIEQVNHVEQEALVNVATNHLHIRRHHKTMEKFIHKLQMWP